MNSLLKKILSYPKPLLQKVSYSRRLKSLGISPDKLVIIATLPRSGTHLLQQLISNSVFYKYCQSTDQTFNPLSLNDVSEMMPNNWHMAYFNYHKYPLRETNALNHSTPSKYLNHFNLADITRSHSLYQQNLFSNSLLVHLRRNPLDYFTSLYFYKYKKRNRDLEIIRSPYDVFCKYKDYFVAMCKSYDAALNIYGQRIRIFHYEELVESPEIVLFQILLFLGLDLSLESCKMIANECTIKKVVEQEAKGESVNPTAYNLTGGFTNGGSIGKWQEFFSDKEKIQVLSYLESNNIETSNFQYLPYYKK